jgi:hypothetical protein
MNLSRQTWVLVLAVALAACSAPAVMHWEKAGANEAKVRDDSDDCRVQARLSQLPPPTVPTPSQSTTTRVLSRDEERALHDTELFQKCMRDKGYSSAKR